MSILGAKRFNLQNFTIIFMKFTKLIFFYKIITFLFSTEYGETISLIEKTDISGLLCIRYKNAGAVRDLVQPNSSRLTQDSKTKLFLSTAIEQIAALNLVRVHLLTEICPNYELALKPLQFSTYDLKINFSEFCIATFNILKQY